MSNVDGFVDFPCDWPVTGVTRLPADVVCFRCSPSLLSRVLAVLPV